MTTTIPDLWSDDIKVNVLTPLAILRSQEGYLQRKTQGMLQAKVYTTESDPLVQHQLDLIVPALAGYRTTLLTARHHKESVYPVTVRAKCFASSLSPLYNPGGKPPSSPEELEANTQDDFIALVRQVLHSGQVRALIQSLLARSNEVQPNEHTPDSAPDRSNEVTSDTNGQ